MRWLSNGLPSAFCPSPTIEGAIDRRYVLFNKGRVTLTADMQFLCCLFRRLEHEDPPSLSKEPLNVARDPNDKSLGKISNLKDLSQYLQTYAISRVDQYSIMIKNKKNKKLPGSTHHVSGGP